MDKMYKSLRFQKFGKYLIEIIVSKLEDDLNEKQDEIVKAVKNISENYAGYSVTTIVKVSSSSAIELALSNFDKNLSQIEWDNLSAKFKKEKNVFKDKHFDVGTLAPRLYLENKSLSLINELSEKYKGNKIKSLKDREVIDMVLFSYCKNNKLI